MLDVNPATGSIKTNSAERVIIQEKLSDRRAEPRIDEIAELAVNQTRAHCVRDVIEALEDQITLDEVGSLMFVTRERVRQIQDRSLVRIRKEDAETGLKLKGLLDDDE